MFSWFIRQWHRHANKWLNHGRPPENMPWKKAIRFSWTPFYEALPRHCGQCGADAVVSEHDFEEIEGTKQAMVVVHSCPMGHGFSVWLA